MPTPRQPEPTPAGKPNSPPRPPQSINTTGEREIDLTDNQSVG